MRTLFFFPSQSSLSPSKDVPGFRRILPRASYLLVSKDCSSNHLPGSSKAEVSVESLDQSLEEHLPSVSLPEHPQFGLASEVELSEQSAIDDDCTKETEVVSYPSDPREIQLSSSSAPSSVDEHASQDSADQPASVVTVKGNEKSLACRGYDGSGVQQGDTTQTVAIIPTQVRIHTANHVANNFNHSITTGSFFVLSLRAC